MGFFIGFLTFILVLTCLVLVLLVLMQLPKKDAGAGLAFGGGATDALFGAGSGNVLTNATKYAATIFFVLALVIGLLQSKYHNKAVSELESAVAGQNTTLPVPSGTQPTPAPAPTAAEPLSSASESAVVTNLTLETTAPAESAPAEPSTTE
jgi:preprotein translocase subunit SecG